MTVSKLHLCSRMHCHSNSTTASQNSLPRNIPVHTSFPKVGTSFLIPVEKPPYQPYTITVPAYDRVTPSYRMEHWWKQDTTRDSVRKGRRQKSDCEAAEGVGGEVRERLLEPEGVLKNCLLFTFFHFILKIKPFLNTV